MQMLELWDEWEMSFLMEWKQQELTQQEKSKVEYEEKEQEAVVEKIVSFD